MAVENNHFWKLQYETGRVVLNKWLEKTQKFVDAYNDKFPEDLFQYQEIHNNWCRRIVDTMVYHTLYQQPTVKIPPIKGLDFRVYNAGAVQINDSFARTSAEYKHREAILDCGIRGSGVVKYGFHTLIPTQSQVDLYGAKRAKEENDGLMQFGTMREPVEGEDHETHIALHQAIMDKPELLAQLIKSKGLAASIRLFAHIEKHRELEAKEKRKGRIDFRLEPNEIWCDRVDPKNFIIDPCVSKIEDARWVAFLFERPLEDVKKDPSLEHTRDLKPMSEQKRGRKSSKYFNSEDLPQPDDENILLIDIFDRKKERRMIITPGSDEFLFNDESPYKHVTGFFPCVQYVFSRPPVSNVNDEPMRAYGESMMAKVWDEQLQLNVLTQVSLDLTKSTLPFMVAGPGADETFCQNMEDSTPGRFLRSKSQNLETVLKQIVPVGNTPDLLMQIRKIEDLIQQTSGFSQQMLAGISEARTATAEQVLQKASAAGVNFYVNVIKKKFIEAAQITRGLIRQYYTSERVVELLGDEGTEYLTITGSDLMSSIWSAAIEVATGPESPAIQSQELQKIILIYNLVAQNPRVNQGEMLKELFEAAGKGRSPALIYSDEQWAQIQANLLAQQQMKEGTGGSAVNGAVDQGQAQQGLSQMQGGPPPGPPVNPQPPQV